MYAFPTTQWSLMQAIQSCTNETRNDILNYLLTTYWKPVYYYARRKGHSEEDAKDLVQGFFMNCIERDFFTRPDPDKGRFRTFLRVSFDHYAFNVKRADRAKRRHPAGGIVSFEELVAGEDGERAFEPRDEETPEDVFNRVWACQLLLRVMRVFREECRSSGKEKHLQIFELRIVKPAIEGTHPPPLQELAEQFGMTMKQAANCLLTARRAYQRLLREVIRTYAMSEDDVATEMNDLLAAIQ